MKCITMAAGTTLVSSGVRLLCWAGEVVPPVKQGESRRSPIWSNADVGFPVASPVPAYLCRSSPTEPSLFSHARTDLAHHAPAIPKPAQRERTRKALLDY